MANQVLYGFTNLQDVFDRRVSEVGVGEVTSAIDQAVAEHNRQMSALIGLFAESTTDFKVRYRAATAARLQALDEQGRALPIKPAGQYDIELPIQRAGLALGVTYEASIKMTVAEMQEKVNTLLMGDRRWMRDHMLASLYTNSSWTWNDDEHGSLTIQGLANNDSTTYHIFAGADSGATDNHYKAQASSIGDANNPFPDIYSELSEHPENEGPYIALIPTNLKSSVMGLSSFYEESDPNVRNGSAVSELTGNLNIAVPGEIIGYVDKVWIVEWRSLPDSYIVAVAAGGRRPLAMRQHPEPELQGFNRDGNRDDWPYFEQQWVRRAGFGGWNRVGALVYRIGNSSYAIPSNYAVPMP